MLRGRNDLAEGDLVAALEILNENYPESHPLRLSCHGKLTSLYMAEGRNGLAIHHGKLMLGLLRASAGRDSLHVVGLENTLATVLLSEGKVDEAKSLAQSALATIESKLGKDHPATLKQLELLAKVFLAEGDGEKAAKVFDRIEKTIDSMEALVKAY
jgi:tetratricopeptide (TPR) repeat protein